MTLARGTLLGPYQILAPVGSGGMGEVYSARDSKLRRTVAVKVLPSWVAGESDMLRRFEKEARAVGALNHPNILTVHDLGNHDGAPFLVSELLDGETLRERLGRGPLPWRQALGVTAQAARGLAAAHEKGIVHRDLKPENLFLTRDGRVKILDFGLAKVVTLTPDDEHETLSRPGLALTVPGTVMGTVGYMSPEQVRGESADQRSDLFSLGVCLFEMFTGERAFARGNPVETMSAILNDQPPPLAEHDPGLPAALEQLLRHCLEKLPEERFQSARDLAFHLETLAPGSGPGTGSVGGPPPRAGEPTQQSTATGVGPRSEKPLLAFGLLAPLVLLLALLGIGHFAFEQAVAAARSALTGQTLASHLGTAQVTAAALDRNLSAVQRRVRREAGQGELRALLAAAGQDGGAELTGGRWQSLAEELYQAYKDRHFYSWVVADRSATVRARSPYDARVVGESFPYREWFTGPAERPAGDLPELVEPRRQAGLTLAFQSTAESQPVLVSVAAPVWPPEAPAGQGEASRREVVGVLMATLHLDTFNEWLANAEVRPGVGGCPERFAVLIHRGQLVRHPCPGQGLAAPPVERDGYAGLAPVEALLRGGSGTSESFQDPLRPGQTFLAAVARLRQNPEWTAIVLQDRAQAMQPITDLARRLSLLGWGTSGVGFAIVAVLWFLLYRVASRTSPSRVFRLAGRRR